MPKKDFWDKIKIIFTIITPFIIIFFGMLINTTLQKNQIKVKYIEIATDILSDKPAEDNIVLRNWAIEILKENSPIVITPEIEQQMKENSISKNYLTGDDGSFLTDDAGNFLQGN